MHDHACSFFQNLIVFIKPPSQMTIPIIKSTSKQRDRGLLFMKCCFIQQGLVTSPKKVLNAKTGLYSEFIVVNAFYKG